MGRVSCIPPELCRQTLRFCLADSRPLVSSAHNTRIERLWVDMTAKVGRKWLDFFNLLHDHHLLEHSLNRHKWLLAYLFLPIINVNLTTFKNQMNCRKMSSARYKSPNQMFHHGSLKKGLRGLKWKEPGPMNARSEDNIDPRTFGASRRRDYVEEQPELETLDEQANGHVVVEDSRCPFAVEGWKEELDRRIYEQSFDRGDQVQLWRTALNVMEDLLELGYGY